MPQNTNTELHPGSNDLSSIVCPMKLGRFLVNIICLPGHRTKKEKCFRNNFFFTIFIFKL